MDTLEQILENLWSSDYVQKNPNKSYKTQYNAEYLAIGEYMNGGSRPNPANYSKMGQVLVGLEDQIRAATPSPEPTPDPPPTGDYYDKLSDLRGVFLPTFTLVGNITQGQTNPAGLGGGVKEIAGGFQFVATPSMHAPWQASKKVCFAQFPIRKAVGGMDTFSFKYCYPRALNPSGLASGWQGGTVFEFGHTTPNSGIFIGSDGRAPDGGFEGHFVTLPKAPWDVGSFDYYRIGDKVLWDHDYVVDAKIRYNPDNTGYVKVTIDGRVVVEANRPTRPNTSEIPLCQPGWYSDAGSDKNGCEIRNLTYSYAA